MTNGSVVLTWQVEELCDDPNGCNVEDGSFVANASAEWDESYDVGRLKMVNNVDSFLAVTSRNGT